MNMPPWTYGLALPILIFLVLFGLQYEAIADEESYFVTSQLAAAKLPDIDIRYYQAHTPEFQANPVPIVATPPLNVYLYGFYGMIVGHSLVLYRLLALGLGIGMFVTLYSILIDLKIKNQLAKSLLFLVYPYTFLLLFTAQSDIIALAFFMLTLKFFIRNKKHDVWLVSLFAILTVLSRQDYWFILPAIITAYVWINWKSIKKKPLQQEHLATALAVGIPLLIVASLILYWGGLLPTVYLELENLADEHLITFSVEKFTFLFVMVGFFFFPLVFAKKFAWHTKYWLILIPAVLALLFPLTQQNCEGIICRVGSYMGSAEPFFYLGLLVAGSYLLLTYLTFKSRVDLIVVHFAAWLLASTVITTLVRQRYYIAFLPLFLVVLFRKYDNKQLLWLWVIFMFAMGLAYSYAKVVLRFGLL